VITAFKKSSYLFGSRSTQKENQMLTFSNAIKIGAISLVLATAAIAAPTLSLDAPVQVTPYKWKFTGSCVPGNGSVSLRVRLSGTTGPATNMGTGSGNCGSGGVGKAITLDMTGKASGSWDVALKQGGAWSNIRQVVVP
jgi:hypothetical protein